MESSAEIYCFDIAEKQRKSRWDIAAGLCSPNFSVVNIELCNVSPARRPSCKTSPCETVDPSTFSCTSWLLQTLLGVMKSLVPRRVDEPTGPFELIFDILLSAFVSRGASKERIAAIPTKKYDEADASGRDCKCAVCLGEFDVGEQVRNLPCTHTFHNECVDPWLAKRKTCPICKKDAC
eukprot:Plantae.Rhodophyta-Palmaria_palmata.ctg7496.p1 GENE.Plantae.Rhodophyta-Palmaria_palmata.ctg7496~~Plantae.Rhodophyta-Palmaria_palmata.ctg7496.p1  ORF type:complete len:179 (+),score=2.74 Plantae.Rhodophyta-Palmaria_palmata.ctg7496:110-646(+)